ncbi:MAG: glycoside hydrolase [Actinomycetota bacterium]|nr:glycoside hydrolase [Actinomycetota bacterium]
MDRIWRRLGRASPRVLLGVALVSLGIGALVLSASPGASVTPSVVSGDTPVNAGATDPGNITANNSPTLARNPARPANLAVANRVDSPRFSCALHVSFDGGGRWSPTRIPIPRGEEPKCFAPDVTFAADGTMYMSYLTLRGRANAPHAVWFVRSRDGGRTLSRPARVLGRFSFQVRITTDPADPRRVYLSWLDVADVGLLRFAKPGNPVRVLRSSDGGRSWERPVRVSSPARPRVVAPSLAVGPKGEVYALYLDLGEDRLDYEAGHRGLGGPPYAGPFRLVLSRSLDGGATWEESVVEDQLVPTERFLVFLPPFPSLAVDGRSGRVYVGFHDGRLGKADVWLWSLPAGGSEWEGPARVNDTAERDRTSQYLPKLAVAPNGRVDVVYYDRRDDPRDVMNEVSFQSSLDGGESFSPAIRISSRQFSSRIGFGSERRMPDLGNRLALASDDKRAVAIWTDTRAGTVASNKQDLARATLAFSEPAGPSGGLRNVLRYGGVALALAGLAVFALGRRRRSPEAAGG